MNLINEGIETISYIYQPTEIILNLLLSAILGLIISWIYKKTHKGLSYSQSFMLTLVFVTIIVAAVMMIIGNSLARAFALVGALSIIRFRTVVKDTKDTAYVFLSLAAGMASGTSSYFLAIFVTAFVSFISYVLNWSDYGAFYKSEFILKFRAPAGDNSVYYKKCLNKFAKKIEMLHIEPSGNDETVHLTYDVTLKKDKLPDELVKELSFIEDVTEVLIIASKHDVDY